MLINSPDLDGLFLMIIYIGGENFSEKKIAVRELEKICTNNG